MTAPPHPGGAAWDKPSIDDSAPFLGCAGAGAASLGFSGVLAACGGTGSDASSPSTSGAPGTAGGFDWASQEITGQLTFANWPLYIDRDKVDGERVYPSLGLFKQESGIDVNYLEAIQAYDELFAKLRMLLEAGQPTGYDLIVMGYPKWLLLMMANDYLITLDHEQLPNFAANAASKYKDPVYDPGNRYSIPYMSGITGHRLRPGAHRRRDHECDGSVRPRVRGEGGMFGDTEDMRDLTLLGMGVEPSESTEDDGRAAADLLIKAA